MTTEYEYWQQELAEPGCNSRDTDEAISGFWRIQSAKTKPDYPVAIWTDKQSGDVLCRIGGNTFKKGTDEWFTFIGFGWTKTVAVPFEVYEQARNTGYWPDGKAARKMSQEEKLGVEVKPDEAGNMPEEIDLSKAVDPVVEAIREFSPKQQAIVDQIEAALDTAKKYTAISTQGGADTANELAERMRALFKQADAERVREKAPFDQAGTVVQAKWKTSLDPLQAEGQRVVSLIKAFLRKEQARLDAQEAAERAKASSEGDGSQEGETTASEAPKARANSKYGRATGLRTVRRGKITDLDTFFGSVKGQEDVLNFLQNKADTLARAKTALPGMEIVETKE